MGKYQHVYQSISGLHKDRRPQLRSFFVAVGWPYFRPMETVNRADPERFRFATDCMVRPSACAVFTRLHSAAARVMGCGFTHSVRRGWSLVFRARVL